MALDEETKRIYRRTDSATLLALLPELRRLSKAAQKEQERVERGQSETPGDEGKFAADLAVYLTIAIERESWIRNELKRRGLLPLWPGEEAHLDEDA